MHPFQQVNARSAAEWDALLACVKLTDPILCNHRITLAHYELSLALSNVLGQEAGANFHTWAVWGSWKAGSTIRQADIPGLTVATSALGSVLGAALAGLGQKPGTRRRISRICGSISTLLVANAVASRLLGRASRMVLEGNRIVLDDIGRVTVRYVNTLGPLDHQDDQALASFLDALRPGPSSQHGQDLLRSAFSHYDQARWDTDADRRHEHMLLGNLQALLHEHMRLEPYIDAAVLGLCEVS